MFNVQESCKLTLNNYGVDYNKALELLKYEGKENTDVVANTMKTLCINIYNMRVVNNSKLEKKLNELGIEVYNDKDKVYKSFIEVIDGVQNIWGKLNKHKKTDLSRLMVGEQNFSKFVVLMEYNI